jgi:hypothetical protein
MSEPPTDGSTWVSAEVFARALEENHALAERVEELEEKLQDDLDIIMKLLLQIGRLTDEIKRLREALREYGHHKPHCSADPCTCGILEALQETDDE